MADLVRSRLRDAVFGTQDGLISLLLEDMAQKELGIPLQSLEEPAGWPAPSCHEGR